MIKSPSKSAGFTLIEVLVAVLVLAIGLLGMAGLHSLSLQSNQSAYQRTQASILAHALVDEMRMNVGEDFDGFEASSFNTTQNCIGEAVTCSAADLANFSKSEWVAALEAAIPGADATVDRVGDIYTITITWTSRVATAGNATAASLTINTQL